MFLVALSEYDQVLVESDNEVSQRMGTLQERGRRGGRKERREECLSSFLKAGTQVLGAELD